MARRTRSTFFVIALSRLNPMKEWRYEMGTSHDSIRSCKDSACNEIHGYPTISILELLPQPFITPQISQREVVLQLVPGSDVHVTPRTTASACES